MQRFTYASAPITPARTSILGVLLCAVLSASCRDVNQPVAPPTDTTLPSSLSLKGSIAGFVLDESDRCIIGARVELLDGPRAGAVFVQTVCGFWDYGADLGFSFHDLPFGVPVTLRATATGYQPADARFAPTNPYSYTNYIVLTKAQ